MTLQSAQWFWSRSKRCEILQKRLTDWMNEHWFGKLSWVFWFSGELQCDGNECKQQKIIQPNVPVSELYWKNLLSWDLALKRLTLKSRRAGFRGEGVIRRIHWNRKATTCMTYPEDIPVIIWTSHEEMMKSISA